MGEHNFAAVPVAIYGVLGLAAAFAYTFLARSLLAIHPAGSPLHQALGQRDTKGNVSLLLYIAATGIAYFVPYAALALYILVASIWFIPDRRIERVIAP
jgi:uncharacterized membrane protein